MRFKGSSDCDFVTLNPSSRFKFCLYSETCLIRTSLNRNVFGLYRSTKISVIGTLFKVYIILVYSEFSLDSWFTVFQFKK